MKTPVECTVCGTLFDAEEEGLCGVIGTFITLNLCIDCYNGVCDMFRQFQCEMCEQYNKEKEEQ